MGIEAIAWAFKLELPDPTAKFVLVALCNYSDHENRAWPSHATIAKITGLSRRAVQNNIKKLEDIGLIVRQSQDRGNGSQTSSMVTIMVGGMARGAPPPMAPDARGMAPDAIGVWHVVHGGMARGAPPETPINHQIETSSNQDMGGKPKIRPIRPLDDWPSDYQEKFWDRYPNKKAKGSALKALDKIAGSRKVHWGDLMVGLERYITCPEVRKGYIKHPATWLNAQCWCDEAGPKQARNLSFFEIAAGHGD